MRASSISLVLVVLLGSLLTGCSTDRWIEVATGEYTPVRGGGASSSPSVIEAVRVDRDNQIVWLMLTGGSQVIVSFSPLPREEWPVGCPANIYSTRMEVLEIETEDLVIVSTTFHRPVLVRDCPPDPEEIVLRSAGAIVGSGAACSGAEECITFERASDTGSLPRSFKGYELYTWQVEEKDAWHFTLVTGTNRLKWYAEISTPESVTTEHDWVKITVRGIDSLKSVLDVLPEGEIVTWNGARHLEGSPWAAGEAFPEKVLVQEIERYCQRRGIRLDVIDD